MFFKNICNILKLNVVFIDHYRYTHEQFLTKIYKLVWDEYKVLTTYTSSKEKILMKYNVCG